MPRDVVTLVTALTAALLGACGGSDASERRCQSTPPREVRHLAEMQASFCAAPAGAATVVATVAATTASARAEGSASVAPSAGAAKAVAVEPATPAPAVAPAASVDPATCELDCERVCGGMCRRLSDTTVECTRIEGGHPCGRSIEGATPPTPAGASEAARLVGMYELEAISACAFDSLAEELEALDAPRGLVARARRSALEERRHAELVRRLLAQRGVSARPPQAPAPRHRTLFAIAAENAAEGCARETIGAALAVVASSRATSAGLRRFYRAIAEDELRHAAWSWDVDAWARTQLDGESARAVDEQRRAALAALAALPDIGSCLPGLEAASRAELSALVAALVAQLEPGLAA